MSCATPTGCSSRARRSPTSRGSPTTCPARTIASYEVIDLLRVSRAIVASAATRDRESRGSHTRRDYPEPVRRDSRPVRRRGGAAAPVFVALPGVVGAARPVVTHVRSARVRSCARSSHDALAEDLGVLGDITSLACVDEDQTAVAAFVARDEGVLAGTALATETFRQLDEHVDVTVERARRRFDRRRAPSSAGSSGPLRVDPHRRARRAQLPVPLLRHRVARRAATCMRGARQGARARHAQDAARAARGPTGGGARRRRLQPPRLALRRGADQGQPPRRARAHAARSNGPRPAWPGRMIEVECDSLDQVVEARDAGVDRVLLDNMTPEQVREAVALLEGVAEGRGLGRHHARDRRRVRRRRAPTSSRSARSRTRVPRLRHRPGHSC